MPIMAASSACPHPKSYVTLLDEFACRLRLTPTYQLIQMEGMSHEPTFVYKVHLDGFEPATGRGKKKQDARQLAARNLLETISKVEVRSQNEASGAGKASGDSCVNQSVNDSSAAATVSSHHIPHLAVSFAHSLELDTDTFLPSISQESTVIPPPAILVEPSSLEAKCPEPPTNKSLNDDSTPVAPAPTPRLAAVPACRLDNPVGSLQELTLSIRWPPPRFELQRREGAAHDATFVMACFVWSYKSTGKGKSKKMAKRLAAHSMYELLQASQEVMELWQKRAEMYAAKTASHHRRAKTAILPQRSPAMQNVHKDLYTSSKACLEVLRQMRPGSVVASLPDPLGFLREVATELSFDILFEDLYDLSKPGKPSARPADSRSPPTPAPECRPAPASILDGSATAASLVILTIPRQIVCFGSGGNKSAARKAAVLNALLYLQTAAQAPFNDGTEATVQVGD